VAMRCPSMLLVVVTIMTLHPAHWRHAWRM
jgi:hypothetical protein